MIDAGSTERPAPVRARASVDSGGLRLALPGDGARLGRFVLLERIGAGAMGVVYAAYDPTLDRRVAIKLLRDAGAAEDRRRVRREAMAMARLSHPNVAQIYEAGELGERLYLAMEFVPGGGLDAWQSAARRPWRAVLEMYAQVGRGLAAAHAAGILHRDFKPHNVLIGPDGRPRVIDFGLAREQSAPLRPDGVGDGFDELDAIDGIDAFGQGDDMGSPDAMDAMPRADESPIDPRQPVTRDGTVVGTPAYMPLEQFRGLALDARSDQFAFCVALYEALYGVAPYPRDDLGALLVALERHRVRPPPADTGVPGWLHAALVRGLAPDPADRWPSMDALLAELARDREHDPETGRSHRLVFVGAVGLVAVVAVVLAVLDNGLGVPAIGDALRYALIVLGGTLAGLGLGRRAVWGSAFNRRVAAYFLSAVGLVVCGRAMAWAVGGDTPTVFALELVALSALATLATATIARWFWTMAAALGLGALGGALWPDWLMLFYSLAVASSCALAVVYTFDHQASRAARRRSREVSS